MTINVHKHIIWTIQIFVNNVAQDAIQNLDARVPESSLVKLFRTKYSFKSFIGPGGCAACSSIIIPSDYQPDSEDQSSLHCRLSSQVNTDPIFIETTNSF